MAACGHASASSKSLRFILSLRLYSSFITSRPDEIEIQGECFNDSKSVAAKLNEYFTSASTILNNNTSSIDYDVNVTNLNQFMNDKIPSDNLL